jgi:hypothetical protein
MLFVVIFIITYVLYVVFDGLPDLLHDAILLGVSLAFICIGHIYQQQIQAVLKTRIFQWKFIDCDFWSLTHFGLFFYLGYRRPNQFWLYFIIGVGWELIEDYLSSNKDTKLINCLLPRNQKHLWCNGIQDDYWYGKYDDILFNTAGFLLGALLKTYQYS